MTQFQKFSKNLSSTLKKLLTLIFLFAILTSTVNAAPNSRTMLFCAISSLASYTGDTNFLMRSMLKSYSFEIQPIEMDSKKIRVRAFLIENPAEDFKIVSICGTESKKDARTDIRFGKIDFDENSQVHHGFLNYTDELLKLAQDEIIATDKKIVLTGHSLGGAVAILTAARLLDFGIASDRIEVVTFGAPAVGDKNFAAEFENRMQLTRYEMQADPVKRSLDALDYVRFGEQINWTPKVPVKETSHAMSIYLDCAIRDFYDEIDLHSDKIKLSGDIPNEDRVYLEKILSDETPIIDALEVKKIRDTKSEEFRLELTEFVYDSSGNLLTMRVASTTTKDLTLLEAARFLKEKLRLELD